MSFSLPASQSPPGENETDAALVFALQQGNKSALTALYDRYSRLVYTIAWRILNSGPEAADLTQEIFMHLWQKSTYDPNRGSLSRFLSTVTRNRAIDRVRSGSNRHRIFKGLTPQGSSVEALSLPEDWAVQGERSHQVREALQALPNRQRDLLWLGFYHGLSQAEIARHTNIPLGTVKSRMRQGLINLKAELQDLAH
ncbi:MAG: sigma-70 family RNA polymerase sigma factor [Leptolyngbya sp. SIOISBB]|nr:sigma-70 family RNA polymerase sigma factor [Leptolyngbya sp. SIOISBB]